MKILKHLSISVSILDHRDISKTSQQILVGFLLKRLQGLVLAKAFFFFLMSVDAKESTSL